MSTNKSAFISFPPGSLTGQPLRIPLLANTEGMFALNKPKGVNGFQERRLGGGARDIAGAIRTRAEAGAGQFRQLGIENAWPVTLPGYEVSGVFLFAKTQEIRAELRNEMGSCHFEFRYHFLAMDALDVETVSCDLPLAVSGEEPVGYVSRRRGKKTVTHFRKLAPMGTCALWEATSAYDRLHQVRIHAAETGIRLLGETVYHPGFRPKPSVDYAQTGSPGIFLHLAGLSFRDGDALTAPYPPRFQEMLRKASKQRHETSSPRRKEKRVKY